MGTNKRVILDCTMPITLVLVVNRSPWAPGVNNHDYSDYLVYVDYIGTCSFLFVKLWLSLKSCFLSSVSLSLLKFIFFHFIPCAM